MFKLSSGRLSMHKKLALALALSSSGYLFVPTSVAFAAEQTAGEEALPTKQTAGEEVLPPKQTVGEEVLPSKQTAYGDEVFPPKYLDFSQFVITADRIPVNKWATPANVITITDKDIEANHYQNIAEALNHVNGVIVPAGVDIPIVNGLEKVLVLIDGHQLYNDGVDYRDTVELSAIPSMKNIKRIEIVKGGGSALYGSDAVTGIINIVTKKGERNETTFDFNTGSWHQHNYELTNQGVVGDFSWFVTGGIHKSKPYNYPGSVERRYNSRSRESDLSDNALTVRLDYKINERNSLTLSGQHVAHKYNRVYEYTNGDRYKSMLYNNVSLVYNFKENSQTPGWLRYFNDYKARNGYDQARNRSEVGDNRVSSFRAQGLDYQNSWIFGQHKIVTGLEWHQMGTKHWSWGYDNRKTINRAAYLQDTISLGKKWKVLPGARYDNNSEFGHQWSPKLAVNYRMDDQTKVYASWGRVYRAATPYQLYVDQSNLKGNPRLSPEKGHTEILGIEHDFGSKAGINLNLFYVDLKDAIDAEKQADGNNRFVNVKNEKTRGVELTFNQKMDEDWSYDLGYVYTKVDIEGFDASGSFTQPRNTYRVGLHYKHGIWQANLLGIMGHGGLSADSFNAMRYAVLDLNVNCKVHDNATIYFKLNNLTNQNYSYYGKNGNNIYTSPGRSFITGVDFRF